MPPYLFFRFFLLSLLLTAPFSYLFGRYWILPAMLPFLYLQRKIPRFSSPLFFWALSGFITATLLSFWIGSRAQPPPLNADWVNRQLSLSGHVTSVIRSRQGENILLQSDNLCRENRCELLYLSFGQKNGFQRGDHLEITGKITVPQNAGFKKHLGRMGGNYVVNQPKVLERLPGNNPLARLEILKAKVESHLETSLPYPQNNLLVGLLTGSRSGLPAELEDRMRLLGLSHILAISGYNISVIILSVERSLFFLRKKVRYPLIIVGIALFTLFVGASAPVLRAAIMGVLGILALRYGRKVNLTNSLLVTAAVMFVADPPIIGQDISFQLSFAATVALIHLAPRLQKFFRFCPEKFGLRENLSLTLAAQIGTLPISLFYFGGLSLIAPLSNILILPLIPATMAFGFFGLVTGLILPKNICFLPAQFLLSTLITAVNQLSALPFIYWQLFPIS